MIKAREDTYFDDLPVEEQEPFLEELFLDLRSRKTGLSAQIWRTTAVAVGALFLASSISPTLTFPGVLLGALATASLFLLIPVVIDRARMKTLRHALAEAASTRLGLPRASKRVDVRERIEELIRGDISDQERETRIRSLTEQIKQRLIEGEARAEERARLQRTIMQLEQLRQEKKESGRVEESGATE